jgi:hypothetical protein
VASRPGNEIQPEDKKAKQQAAEDEVLMREIDEAVRQDDLAQFASKYGKPLLGLLIAAIGAFGGYLFWDARNESELEAQSEKLVAALDQAQAGNFDSANDLAASLASESDGGAGTAAKLLQASIALQQGRNDDAVALFAQVSVDENAAPALRDLATIREITTNFGERDPDEVISRLGPLAVPGNPWFGSAGELVAMAHLEKGERQQAGTLFGEIAKSESVPQSLRSRARQMASLLGVDAVDDVDALLASQGLDTANANNAAEIE